MSTRWSGALERLGRPVDGASIAAFRVAFGLLMAGSAARFLISGWVERCFVQPTFFFTYWGFEWVRVLPASWMTALFVAQIVLGLLIALRRFTRAAALTFFVVFTYVELIDVTNYLNHYYLVSLLALLLAVVPAGPTVPTWALWLLRFQVGAVYVFAALAKLEPDWVLHGEPMQIWMSSRTDTPLIGPLLGRYDVCLLMSWAGIANDLFAVPLLLWRRSRPWAFGMILMFHAATFQFFNIGIFPILMPLAATLFFEPSWPRRLLGHRIPAATTVRARPMAAWLAVLLATYVLVQVALPLRCHAYGGNVLWHEQGMRFSWRVMLRKKSGAITYRVRTSRTHGREVEVSPRRFLTDHQEREFSGQPDLILQLAHHVADTYRARGHRDVQVRVDAWVSLNGRAPARMIDPEVDLARVDDGLGRATWILPAPGGPPARVGR